MKKTQSHFYLFMAALLMFSINGAALHAQQKGLEPASQTDVTNDELERFASVLDKIQDRQEEAEAEILEKLNAVGMAPERFSQLAMAEQHPEIEIEASQEELEQFNEVNTTLADLQSQLENDVVEIVSEEGFTEERFSEIYQQVQIDPVLQQRLMQMIEEEDN